MDIKNHREEVIKYIERVAPHYTPEWLLDRNARDLGSAFALTFADMFSDTLSRYDKLFHKNYIEFLNSTGIEPLGRQAANGCVVFYLAQGAPTGIYVETDAVLYDDSGEVAYVTENPVYVTPASLEAIYFTSRNADEIILLYDGNAELVQPLRNVQEHEVYICHDWAFNVGSGTEISIWFHNAEVNLLGGENAEWSYFSDDWMHFESIDFAEDRIIFKIDGNSPFTSVELFGKDSFYIRCRGLNIETLADFSADEVDISVSSAQVTPFNIYHNYIQLDNESAYPFGKTLSIYDDFFIECREAFSKKGALIEIDFEIISYRQDLINYMPEPPVQWKRVMPKSKFKSPETFDIEIKEVSIDYWNGLDFVRLNTDESISKVFEPSGMLLPKKISFICPEDMKPVIINGCESMWIRIRTLEISNLYKNNAHNIVPCIKNMNIAYSYTNNLKPVIHTKNNITIENYFTGKPFKQMEHLNTCIFFGLNQQPGGSPIAFLFDVESDIYATANEISWYLWGRTGWNRVLITDNTENLKKSGVITFYLDEQPVKRTMFGKELYWLKAEFGTGNIVRNIFNRIYLNATTVVQKTSPIEEFLNIDRKDKTATLNLDLSRLVDLEARLEGEVLSYTLDYQNECIVFDEKALNKINRLDKAPVIELCYRLSDGEKGNLPANSITKTHMSMGYISGVNNPLPVTGGRSMELMENIIKRGADSLAHRHRAVTAQDFEALAYKSTGNIIKCKCIAERNNIKIIYLPDDYNVEKRAVSYTSNKIVSYISERASPLLRITAIEPIYIEIGINAQVRIVGGSVIKSKDEIEERLTTFLNPVAGNFRGNGFDIGSIPDENFILSFLKSLKIVKYIEHFSLSAFKKSKGVRREINFGSITEPEMAIPISGEHTIVCNI